MLRMITDDKNDNRRSEERNKLNYQRKRPKRKKNVPISVFFDALYFEGDVKWADIKEAIVNRSYKWHAMLARMRQISVALTPVPKIWRP